MGSPLARLLAPRRPELPYSIIASPRPLPASATVPRPDVAAGLTRSFLGVSTCDEFCSRWCWPPWGWSPPPCADSLFDFNLVPTGTSTPFADTQTGLTATFTSPADPGGFVVGTAFFATLTGNVLLSPGPAAANNIPLVVTFDQPATGVDLLFALNDPGNTTSLTLEAFSGGVGGTLVGTANATGAIPLGFIFPEGSLSFSGTPFDTIRS